MNRNALAPIATAAIALFAPSFSIADSPAQAGTEFEQMVAGFGQINTIAGRGFADDCNGWNSSMELGQATSAELSRPHMAQADAAGNVYIADKEGHAIRKVRPDGVIATVAGNGTRGDGAEGPGHTVSLREPNGLYTFPDGTTFILELDDDCNRANPIPTPGGKIRRLGADGMMTTVFTDSELVGGRGLWVSPDESLVYYCSFDTVRKWTPDGGIETFASGFSQGGFRGLGNIDIDPLTGQLCVTDREASRVYRLSPDGSTRMVIAGNGFDSGGGHGQAATATGLDEVRGIAFRPDGSFFVCTHKGEHAVWFVDTAGLIWKFIDGQNNAHGGDGMPVSQFPQNAISEPRAVTIAPNGDLLITERDEGHVRRVTNTCIAPKLLSFDPAMASITWTTQREANYMIQESRDLKNWTAIFDVETSNGPTTTVVIGGPSLPRQYFRAVEY